MSFLLVVVWIAGSLCRTSAGLGSLKDAHSKEVGFNSNMTHFLHKHGLQYKEWSEGIEFEKNFWAQWMETKGGVWSEDYNNRVKKQRRIDDMFVDAMPPLPPGVKNRTHALILDAGAGPMSLVGNWHPDMDIELIAVDPLSYLYNELLHKFNLVPYPRVQHAFVERVSELYPSDFFDVVHIQNALDHSGNPRGIFSMWAKTWVVLLMMHVLMRLSMRVGSIPSMELQSQQRGKFTITKGWVRHYRDDEVKGVEQHRPTRSITGDRFFKLNVE